MDDKDIGVIAESRAGLLICPVCGDHILFSHKDYYHRGKKQNRHSVRKISKSEYKYLQQKLSKGDANG